METIDDFAATSSFKLDMLFYAQEQWAGIADEINKIFKVNPPIPKNDFAVFDYFLAILFLESRAPYNLYNQERGNRIWQYLLNCFAAEKQFGEYATESLELYLEVWNMYITKQENPIGGIASVLLNKLGYYEEQNANILFGTMLMDFLALSPAWWKKFSKENKLIDSDIPIDSENFKNFAKDANPNENTINDYDYNGLTMLMRAVEICKVDLVQELLSKGADPLKTNKFGTMTSVDIALNKFMTTENRERREQYHWILDIMKDYCEKI